MVIKYRWATVDSTGFVKYPKYRGAYDYEDTRIDEIYDTRANAIKDVEIIKSKNPHNNFSGMFIIELYDFDE